MTSQQNCVVPKTLHSKTSNEKSSERNLIAFLSAITFPFFTITSSTHPNAFHLFIFLFFLFQSKLGILTLCYYSYNHETLIQCLRVFFLCLCFFQITKVYISSNTLVAQPVCQYLFRVIQQFKKQSSLDDKLRQKHFQIFGQ